MPTSSEPRAGGAIIALSTLAGTLAGLFAGQPTIGLLGGLAAGAIVALAIWMRDRRR